MKPKTITRRRVNEIDTPLVRLIRIKRKDIKYFRSRNAGPTYKEKKRFIFSLHNSWKDCIGLSLLAKILCTLLSVLHSTFGRFEHFCYRQSATERATQKVTANSFLN